MVEHLSLLLVITMELKKLIILFRFHIMEELDLPIAMSKLLMQLQLHAWWIIQLIIQMENLEQ